MSTSIFRAHDAQLKREIAHVMATQCVCYEQARRRVVGARGWCEHPP